LKLQYDQPLSNCDSTFNLRRYNKADCLATRAPPPGALVLEEQTSTVVRCRLTLIETRVEIMGTLCFNAETKT